VVPGTDAAAQLAAPGLTGAGRTVVGAVGTLSTRATAADGRAPAGDREGGTPRTSAAASAATAAARAEMAAALVTAVAHPADLPGTAPVPTSTSAPGGSRAASKNPSDDTARGLGSGGGAAGGAVAAGDGSRVANPAPTTGLTASRMPGAIPLPATTVVGVRTGPSSPTRAWPGMTGVVLASATGPAGVAVTVVPDTAWATGTTSGPRGTTSASTAGSDPTYTSTANPTGGTTPSNDWAVPTGWAAPSGWARNTDTSPENAQRVPERARALSE
jgi:hypothetical protein